MPPAPPSSSPPQYLEEAENLCDRLAIIDGSRIVTEGTPAQLKAEMGHDVVSVSLEGADIGTTERALAGLPALQRAVVEPDGLALYVEDGPRRLEGQQSAPQATAVKA